MSESTSSNHILWYTKPAPLSQWTEALPIGNGALGGMVFGGIRQEKIQLNEDSLWYGGPQDGDNPDASMYLPEIKRLITEGNLGQAEYLARMALMSKPKYLPPYQPLAELLLWFSGEDAKMAVHDYNRQLDLNSAVVSTKFTSGGFAHEREYFCSAPDQVMAIQIRTDCPRGLVMSFNLMRRPFDDGTETLGNDTLILKGKAGEEGVRFACVVKLIIDGGEIRPIGDFISLEGARTATLLLASATTYRYSDPEQICLDRIAAAAAKGYEQLKKSHEADYRKLFHRVSLKLSEAEVDPGQIIPTDQRLRQFQQGKQDLGLIELYYQYGRYLIISSSRPGSLPITLQGIWNNLYTPPWESKYTINLNIQMNYWPVEASNLSECHEPLFDLIDRMRPNGRRTAELIYGCRGFVAHHNTNLWGETQIEGIQVAASIWPMGGAWLTLHMWEHYSFHPDVDFLKTRAYPALKEAAQFYLDYMFLNEHGYLVTGPSLSPENRYRLPSGEVGSLCFGPTMDIQIVRALFLACMEANSILDIDDEFSKELKKAYDLLPPDRIGKHGQIMEWQEDYDEFEPGHRHISHLFALYPGEEITPYHTPDLAKAANKTLERRLEHGAGGNGWSRSWMINFYARLADGNAAEVHLRHLLADSTYPNLFDSYPPFQIDGNLGATAGINEMLLQSHRGELILLPALADAWQDGYIKGLRARGGLEIDISWSGGILCSAAIKAQHSGLCRIRSDEPLQVVHGSDPVPSEFKDSLLKFEVEKDKVYVVTMIQ